MARRHRDATAVAAGPPASSPEWLTITATITTTPDGATSTLVKPGEAPIELEGVSEAAVRRDVLGACREYVEWLGRPARLRVTDSQATWPLVIGPDGTVTEEGQPNLNDRTALPSDPPTPVELRAVDSTTDPSDDILDELPAREPAAPAFEPATPTRDAAPAARVVVVDPETPERPARPQTVERPAPTSPRRAPGARPPRREPAKGPAARLLENLRHGLKDKAQLREEQLDGHLDRRHLVRRANKIAVVSPKGGPGKSMVSILIGDLLASRLNDQRVAAIDFNPGGGVLSAVTGDDRGAERTMLELYNDREEIHSLAQLQPYVASLSSGLDVLSVPPDVGLALAIKPDHYSSIFEEILDDSYTLMVLDTSPDVASAVTQLALQTATQMVIVCEQGYMESGVVTNALPYLLSTPAAGRDGSAATVVINGVISDDRAGRVQDVRDEILSIDDQLPIIEIPMDLDLRSVMNSGSYTLSRVQRRSTRVPVKELVVEVMRRFV